eukprot:TRINITY_DN4802_c0_g1_i1.p1 TRINITY_DN4802_c0_g1~~TRINITY_DN4802_c0_g1_i1.p1  ORF type:complete len:156 (+),score=22.49 TRINITY_DN4802_c0_g1_i1:331-798(+)
MEVVQKLIPLVMEEWHQLMERIKNKIIRVTSLEQTFQNLHSDEEYRLELIVLAQTGNGKPPDSTVKIDWVDNILGNMQDFSLLVRMQKWLPALLKIRKLVAPLLTLDADKDPHFKELTQLLEAHKQRWDQQTLGSLSILVEPIKKEKVPTAWPLV